MYVKCNSKLIYEFDEVEKLLPIIESSDCKSIKREM